MGGIAVVETRSRLPNVQNFHQFTVRQPFQKNEQQLLPEVRTKPETNYRISDGNEAETRQIVFKDQKELTREESSQEHRGCR